MVKTWSKIVFGSISLSLLIAGCSGSEDSGKTIVQSDDDAVETFSDLPKCTNKSADRIVTVTKEEADYICNASSREWVEIVTKFRDLPSCTNKREGDVFYVLRDEDYYYCTSSEWLTEEERDTPNSSSSKENSGNGDSDKSSDSGKRDESSSSLTEESEISSSSSSTEESEISSSSSTEESEISSSSSSTEESEISSSSSSTKETETSSSSSKEETFESLFDGQIWLWNGVAGDTKVNTGYTEGGYWFPYSDMDGNGESYFVWDVNSVQGWRNGERSTSYVKLLVESCQSICGEAFLKNSNYPDGNGNFYAGIGFDIVSEAKESVNITNWKGFVVVYMSEEDLTMGIEGHGRQNYGYDDYRAVLPATSKPTKITLEWKDFAQRGGDTARDMESVLRQVEMIDFQYLKAQQTQSKFKIYALGKISQ